MSGQSEEKLVSAARVLCGDGEIRAADVRIRGGRIAEVRPISGGGRRGPILLPGIVDLHGDAFERQLMPRAGVRLPCEMALTENDRQLIANGITTAYYGLTISWEPGLRGSGAAREFLEQFHRLKHGLRSDSRLHLRFEIFGLDAVESAVEWLQSGWVDLLAFNDHTGFISNRIATRPEAIDRYTDRTSLSADDYLALLDSVQHRKDEVPGAVRRLAAAAAESRIPMASHDDESPAMRRWYHDVGCSISEFPIDRQTAAAAVEFGNDIVLGAPNVIRGRSHAGRLTASEAIASGLGSILCSDYYYPALMAAPFRLAHDGILGFGSAWNLVSRNPAQAACLTDRGIIEEGKRADLLLVDDSDPLNPSVVAVMAGGRIAFAAETEAAPVAIHPSVTALSSC